MLVHKKCEVRCKNGVHFVYRRCVLIYIYFYQVTTAEKEEYVKVSSC